MLHLGIMIYIFIGKSYYDVILVSKGYTFDRSLFFRKRKIIGHTDLLIVNFLPVEFILEFLMSL